MCVSCRHQFLIHRRQLRLQLHAQRDKLRLFLRDELGKRRQKVIFFNVDDDANYGEAVRVMDVCRGAGVKTLVDVRFTPFWRRPEFRGGECKRKPGGQFGAERKQDLASGMRV